MSNDYRPEAAERLLMALAGLWDATDYPETYDLSHYKLTDLSRVLADWEQVRKACDKLYWQIRDAHPGLQGDFRFEQRPLEGFDRTPDR